MAHTYNYRFRTLIKNIKGCEAFIDSHLKLDCGTFVVEEIADGIIYGPIIDLKKPNCISYHGHLCKFEYNNDFNVYVPTRDVERISMEHYIHTCALKDIDNSNLRRMELDFIQGHRKAILELRSLKDSNLSRDNGYFVYKNVCKGYGACYGTYLPCMYVGIERIFRKPNKVVRFDEFVKLEYDNVSIYMNVNIYNKRRKQL